jgi:archaellum biogenesis ATPase FlaH
MAVTNRIFMAVVAWQAVQTDIINSTTHLLDQLLAMSAMQLANNAVEMIKIVRCVQMGLTYT